MFFGRNNKPTLRFARGFALAVGVAFGILSACLIWPRPDRGDDGEILLAYLTLPMSLVSHVMCAPLAKYFGWSISLENLVVSIISAIFGIIQYMSLAYAIGLGLGTIFEMLRNVSTRFGTRR